MTQIIRFEGMMIENYKPTTEARIAGKIITMDPLAPEQFDVFRALSFRLASSIGGKRTSKEFFGDMKEAVGFIFLCAKPHHPELIRGDLESRASLYEIKRALEALLFLTHSTLSIGGKANG